jgi:hypothetical protein
MVYPFKVNWENFIRAINDHLHAPQLVYPVDTTVVTLTSGGAPDTLGAFSADIVPASPDVNAVPAPFDIHWADIGQPDTNANYTVVLYAGPTDTEIGRLAFQRFNATNISTTKPFHCEILQAGVRVRGKLMDSIGGSVCTIKIYLHTYDHILP